MSNEIAQKAEDINREISCLVLVALLRVLGGVGAALAVDELREGGPIEDVAQVLVVPLRGERLQSHLRKVVNYSSVCLSFANLSMKSY